MDIHQLDCFRGDTYANKKNPKPFHSRCEQKHVSYQHDQLIERIHYLKKLNGSSFKRLYQQAQEDKGIKSYRLVAPKQIQEIKRLNELAPNISEVTDYIAQSLCLPLYTNNRIMGFRPILLLGDPGIGKSYITKLIARFLGIDFKSIDMGSLTSAFELQGNNSSWNSSQPGQLARAAIESPIGNFMLLLDEIDKAPTRTQYPPLNALYPLLEEHTAKYYRDAYLEMAFDLSKLMIIATANTVDTIHPALLSRFYIINIKKPTAQQQMKIVKAIFHQLIKDKHIHEIQNKALSTEIIHHLSKSSPREIKRKLEIALSKSAYERASRFNPEQRFDNVADLEELVLEPHHFGIKESAGNKPATKVVPLFNRSLF
ncbi:AAA family ATPase [Oceanicoccus sagamiensis]|uniref:AAA+ ATPase domain-containing protein n=1 Tax=Oceanicoccus sagamiensis TaxID=716816 RepID=A0A1X9NAB7_9GAMM|nr:AAA family ATPase [Oceanicoccus sagamiensis]ARN74004.1 hypothetical protein BST96_07655 [Oceanicoccus sagamiensis]